MDRLAALFPGLKPRWTGGAALPGGDFPCDGFDAMRDDLARRHAFLPASTATRLARAYGTDATAMLGDARDFGDVLGADLTTREVDWMVRNEWARTSQDVLWRRSKLGLRFSAAETAVLERYLPALSPGQ